jgi:serine/threonine protein phosphatase PrpC
MINHRIKSLQYEANDPCEDSLSYYQLKTIDAYAISIFDGHGGPELAEYSRSKINTFIDSFIQDNLKKPFVDIGELIKESLKWSYQKIEDNFF